MDRRQRILVALLAVIFVAYAGDQLYRRFYEQPLDRANQSIAAFEAKLHEGTLDARRLQNRLPKLDELRQRSLPRELDVAVTEYRSWLLQTITSSGLTQQSLDSTAPARVRGLYDRLGFTMRGQGTIAELTRFLQVFYNTDYLHKIRSMSLAPTAAGGLDITLSIESLALPAVAEKDHLPEPRTKPGSPSMDTLHVISRRNIFRQGDAPASQIKLSAITVDRQHNRQAWLSSQTTGETHRLSEGDGMSVEGTDLQIQRITRREIEIDIDGRREKVAIGQPLQSP